MGESYEFRLSKDHYIILMNRSQASDRFLGWLNRSGIDHDKLFLMFSLIIY
jgi:hypothetical protein